MAANFTSKLGDWRKRHARAVDAGLVAAALVPEGVIKRRLVKGYTSGKFKTGRVANSVTHSQPATEGDARVIRIGTNVAIYPLAWELGHANRWTGKYERVQVWVPAVMENREAMIAKFQAVYARLMGAGV